jgi:hypothetical protein
MLNRIGVSDKWKGKLNKYIKTSSSMGDIYSNNDQRLVEYASTGEFIKTISFDKPIVSPFWSLWEESYLLVALHVVKRKFYKCVPLILYI